MITRTINNNMMVLKASKDDDIPIILKVLRTEIKKRFPHFKIDYTDTVYPRLVITRPRYTIECWITIADGLIIINHGGNQTNTNNIDLADPNMLEIMVECLATKV